MAGVATAPPVLSTPDTHILNDISDATLLTRQERLSDHQVEIRYEVARTIKEIRENKWRRVALQFPDEMLSHSARVYQMLQRGLGRRSERPQSNVSSNKARAPAETAADTTQALSDLSIDDEAGPVKLTILADTSYGSCCVDEIAGEHVDADAIIHYGRACLSPTARLPVVHIYTQRKLDLEHPAKSFEASFPDRDTKVIVTADVPYASHVQLLCSRLQEMGCLSVFAADIIHEPSSSIPNRTVPPSISEDPLSMRNWHLFHISEPPTSLLLTLTSRMASIVVYPTSDPSNTAYSTTTTSMVLRRRYALITSLATVPIWGILINTLSVRNYLSMITHVQKLISDAGKKSYLFVVGKINAAKVANFSEIGGWVVIGCWESSLIDSKEFYKPIITPFELELALRPDESRVWTGEWRADFAGVLESSKQHGEVNSTQDGDMKHDVTGNASDEESDEAPEFDLRTGRYVSKSRPMAKHRSNGMISIANGSAASSTALTKRANGDMVQVNGIASPAAEFLAKQRTWRGLGSDLTVGYEDQEEEGALVEEGQTGVAGGYAVGESEKT